MEEKNRNIFVEDTRDSCHTTRYLEGMIYLKNIYKDITIETGKARKDTNIGKEKVMIKLAYGKNKTYF